MSLSQNQLDALNKPCAKCVEEGTSPVGIIVKRTGQYGDFVSCSNWPRCNHKIYKPRGLAVKQQREREGRKMEMDRPFKRLEDVLKHIDSQGNEIQGSGQGNGESKSQIPPMDSEEMKQAIKKMAEEMLKDEKENLKKQLDKANKKLEQIEANKPTVIQVKENDIIISETNEEHFLMPRLLRLILAGFHIYLWGDAGTGKTSAALKAFILLKRLAEIDTLDMSTFRSMIQGYMTPNGDPVHTTFTRCWINGKGYIADEADNCPGHVQTLFNSALANGHAPLAWGNVEQHKDFAFVATGNTPGRPTRQFPDRKPMSAAFLDRLYFIQWPLDEGIEARAAGMALDKKQGINPPSNISKPDWVTWVRDIRKWAKEQMPTLIVTPRASLLGLKALEVGEAAIDVANALVFRGADEEMIHKALKACPLP